MKHRILTADYHRNGVGGAGFYVAIVETTGALESPSRFLITWFPKYNEPERTIDYAVQDRMAVVSLDMAHKGNIGMYPIINPHGVTQEGTGGNAWRGSDNWGHDGELYRLIHEWCEESSEQNVQRIIAEQNERKRLERGL